MIFADGTRRAGIFEQNLFVKSVRYSEDIDPYREILDDDCLAELEMFVQDYLQRMEEKKELIRQRSLERREQELN